MPKVFIIITGILFYLLFAIAIIFLLSNRIFIPKNIFQTHKSIDYLANNQELVECVKSWRSLDGYRYYFYDDKDCEIFIKNEYPDIFDIYNNLPLPVMKADLWRYCIIYKYGGIYADVDTKLISEPENLIKKSYFVGVPENKEHMCQWVFAAPAGSPILRTVIDECLEKCKNIQTIISVTEHYVHELTGPAVFTSGINKWMKKQKIETNSDVSNYSKYKNKFMWIHNPNKFHNQIVKHFFNGGKQNEWINQSKQYRKSLINGSINFN